MQSIHPISGLQNKSTEISRGIHDGSEPVIPIRNDPADTTVMNLKTLRSLEFDNEDCRKLKEAERQAVETDMRYTPEEVLSSVRQIIATA